MTSAIIEILIMLLGAAIFGYLVGRLCGRCNNCGMCMRCGNTSSSQTVVATPVPQKPTGTKDDLKQIEGIGAGIEKLLNTEGIHTFDHVVHAPVERIRAILTKAGPIFASHDPATWREQAILARDGKWIEFETLKKELVNGIRIK